jgi:endo-alpha-1,4-polygalactosaminidase (GH114 family)
MLGRSYQVELIAVGFMGVSLNTVGFWTILGQNGCHETNRNSQKDQHFLGTILLTYRFDPKNNFARTTKQNTKSLIKVKYTFTRSPPTDIRTHKVSVRFFGSVHFGG